MSSPHKPHASSVYGADLSSNTTSLEANSKEQNHRMLRWKNFPFIEPEYSPRRSTVIGHRIRPQVEIRHRDPAPEIEDYKNPRRFGKADWEPDVSSVLFSASGQQYGLGDHQRGYHSKTYVTRLSYTESVTDQPREARRPKILRRLKRWPQTQPEG